MQQSSKEQSNFYKCLSYLAILHGITLTNCNFLVQTSKTLFPTSRLSVHPFVHPFVRPSVQRLAPISAGESQDVTNKSCSICLRGDRNAPWRSRTQNVPAQRVLSSVIYFVQLHFYQDICRSPELHFQCFLKGNLKFVFRS